MEIPRRRPRPDPLHHRGCTLHSGVTPHATADTQLRGRRGDADDECTLHEAHPAKESSNTRETETVAMVASAACMSVSVLCALLLCAARHAVHSAPVLWLCRMRTHVSSPVDSIIALDARQLGMAEARTQLRTQQTGRRQGGGS